MKLINLILIQKVTEEDYILEANSEHPNKLNDLPNDYSLKQGKS